MNPDYWQRQQPDEPLFPDMLWSRPENKTYAGKLLIVGGHAQSFARPAEAYGLAEKAGIGSARVVLPDALRKTVGKIFPAAEFAPSTPSGSFATTALGEFLPMSAWADGVLLAGDFGRNSETAILLEKFVTKHRGPVAITCDAADYFITTPEPLHGRADTLLVVSFAQLQKLAQKLKFTSAFTFSMDFLRLIETLHTFSGQFGLHIIVKHLDTIFVAAEGQVSTTKQPASEDRWRLQTASTAAVWWLQTPSKPFAALTTAIATMQ